MWKYKWQESFLRLAGISMIFSKKEQKVSKQISCRGVCAPKFQSLYFWVWFGYDAKIHEQTHTDKNVDIRKQ